MRRLPQHITQSFQVFAAAQCVLGAQYLTQLWKRSTAQVYRWGTNPSHSVDTYRHNPLDLLLTTLREMQQRGHEDLIEDTLLLLAEPFGLEVRPKEIKSEKGARRALGDVIAALGRVAERLPEGLEDPQFDVTLGYARDLCRRARELLDAINKRRA